MTLQQALAGRSTVVVASALPGAGCSVAAGALASVLATRGSCAVLDVAPRVLSPWPRAVTRRARAGFTVGSPKSDTVRAMVSSRELLAPAGAGFDVLTEVSSPAGADPRDLAWWRDARAAGGWLFVLVDLGTPLLTDPLACARWARCTSAVLVLVVPTTRPAVAAATRLITSWEAGGSTCGRVVLARLSRAPGRSDGRVLAELTMLDRRVGAIVPLPFDRELHRGGLRGIDRMQPRTARAYRRLADTALDPSSLRAIEPSMTRTLQEVS